MLGVFVACGFGHSALKIENQTVLVPFGYEVQVNAKGFESVVRLFEFVGFLSRERAGGKHLLRG